MEYGFYTLIALLLGVYLYCFIQVLIYLRNLVDGLLQLNQFLDEQNMKLDCIAEWLIDQDPDCDPDDLVEFPVDDFEITDFLHSIGNIEDQFGSAEEWKQFYEEDVNNE